MTEADSIGGIVHSSTWLSSDALIFRRLSLKRGGHVLELVPSIPRSEGRCLHCHR